MAIRVELLPLAILSELGGIEPLQAVLLESGHDHILGHFQAVEEIVEVFVRFGLAGNLVRWHGTQGAVEIVDGFDQILSEALDGECLGRVDVTAGALLEIAEFGNRAEVFILVVREVG